MKPISIDKRTHTGQAMLCPVLWCSPFGLVSIMRAAKPLTTKMPLEEYMAMGHRWDARTGEESPFESKEADWGWYQGRLVALDYSTPAWDRAVLGE
jgi:hypothetical protein